MADILVSGIITKEATGVFLNSTGESNHIHSNAKKTSPKNEFSCNPLVRMNGGSI